MPSRIVLPLAIFCLLVGPVAAQTVSDWLKDKRQTPSEEATPTPGKQTTKKTGGPTKAPAPLYRLVPTPNAPLSPANASPDMPKKLPTPRKAKAETPALPTNTLYLTGIIQLQQGAQQSRKALLGYNKKAWVLTENQSLPALPNTPAATVSKIEADKVWLQTAHPSALAWPLYGPVPTVP